MILRIQRSSLKVCPVEKYPPWGVSVCLQMIPGIKMTRSHSSHREGNFQMRLTLQVQIKTLLQLKLLQLPHQQVSHLLQQVELLNLYLVWILPYNSFMKH